ncbi:MAG: C39 family peptidase [Deltaproteobacteria bacterium]|nr:C39 family peptidase [Deltaproteobacteria bacterium]
MIKIKMISGILLISIGLYCCASRTPVSGSQDMPLKAGWVCMEQPLRSWKYLRDQNVAIQRYDYSCGSGALATLMRYYFGDNVSEEEILARILNSLTYNEVLDREKKGLSLLDLKRCAEQRGYQAVAVKLDYANLLLLKGPVLIHLEREDYRHFSVLKGVIGDRVYLADPSRGNIRMSIDRFAQEWSGVALILGRADFGLPEDYPLALDEMDLSQNEMLTARRFLLIR